MRTKPNESAITGYLLLLATYVLEVPGFFARALLALIPVAIIWGEDVGYTAAMVAGFAPIAWSLLAFVYPGRGIWWRRKSGGRSLSTRELETIHSLLDLYDQQRRHGEPEPPTPSAVFIVEDPEPQAAVRGRAVMITSGLMRRVEALRGVLAHELFHVRSDGRIIEALNRLALWGDPVGPRRPRDQVVGPPPTAGAARAEANFALLGLVFAFFRFIFRVVVFIAGGTLGQLLLRPLWMHYWRQREYLADAYTARLGAGYELLDYLEQEPLFFDVSVPFLFFNPRTHPPTEHRIESLEGWLQVEGEARGSQEFATAAAAGDHLDARAIERLEAEERLQQEGGL